MATLLRLLGSTELIAQDGSRHDALLAQPKRLALLAYLAVDRPVRMHRRDSLLSLFWPDADEVHSRGALSQALSFIRRSLPDVIVSRGLEEVGVESTLLTTDVDRFETAADAGEHATALAHYVGDLLAGFHVGGCNDFEDWLTAERQRLRERATRSAKAIARDSLQRGDLSGAVVASRHALLLAPFDESAARSALAALVRSGGRALALNEYDAFRRRLRTELGLEPSAELQHFVDEIRNGASSHGERHSLPAGDGREDSVP